MTMTPFDDAAHKVAEFLLQIKAIKLQPEQPFTWASGWKSPIYCDNRKTLSYPQIRTFIRQQYVNVINEKFGKLANYYYIALNVICCILGVLTDFFH